MNLTLVVANNCNTCIRAEEHLKKLASEKQDISLSVVNINDYKGKGIVIVPALLINDELFSYGDVDEAKLIVHLP